MFARRNRVPLTVAAKRLGRREAQSPGPDSAARGIPGSIACRAISRCRFALCIRE